MKSWVHIFAKLSITVIVMQFAFIQSSFSKDLSHRLGVGFSNVFAVPLPSISTQYYPSQKLSLSASIGVDTKDLESKFGFMVKLNRILFMEDNMNFYMGTGAGLVSEEVKTASGSESENQSGFELLGFAGSEFFFSGIESLGFSIEMGIGVVSVSSEVRFRTLGGLASVIFYF